MTYTLAGNSHVRALCAALAVLALAGFACSDEDDDPQASSVGAPGASGGVVKTPIPGGQPAGSSSPGGSGASGAAGPGRSATISVGEQTRAQYCAGNGPPIEIIGVAGGGSSAMTACRSGLASEIFKFGLCACEDATFTGAFEIDALDSSQGAAPGNQIAASVGINDDLVTTGVLDIRGSLIAASSGLTPITAGSYNIDGNFATNSDLVTTGANITFGRDLWVNGDILSIGLANVQGDVYQTPPHTLTGMTVAGQVLKQDFTVAEPCACGEDQILDIAAIVAAGKANSHNAELGLDDGNRVDIGIGVPLDLECGRFAFEAAHFVGVHEIRAHGRTALFIDGDLTITGAFGVDLGSSGELDVFVTGNLLLTGSGDVGTIDRPAALRFYVGGRGDIAITGAHRFAANLYAPRAAVFVTGADDIYGSFFVGSYFVTGAQRMHYDAAILQSGGDGESCTDDPPDCTRDLDCGSPNVCTTGTCRPLNDGPF
jgi:hypothetical protein